MHQRDIALNYIYLSKNHAGGKDQVGLNLLKGLQEIGFTDRIKVICYDHSVETVKNIAKDVEIISIPSHDDSSELVRMARVSMFNTFPVKNSYQTNKIHHIWKKGNPGTGKKTLSAGYFLCCSLKK